MRGLQAVIQLSKEGEGGTEELTWSNSRTYPAADVFKLRLVLARSRDHLQRLPQPTLM